MVCSLPLRKGIPDLIEAFELIAAGYPSPKLYIVGEGQDRAQFVAQATGSPFAARIIFLGFVKDPREWAKRNLNWLTIQRATHENLEVHAEALSVCAAPSSGG
jgi:glycosyltransferase involved in cell wall biosynthesis